MLSRYTMESTVIMLVDLVPYYNETCSTDGISNNGK